MCHEIAGDTQCNATCFYLTLFILIFPIPMQSKEDEESGWAEVSLCTYTLYKHSKMHKQQYVMTYK